MPSANVQVRSRERTLTVSDLAEAGYDLPGELVRGQFTPLAPTSQRHAEVESNLAFALQSFVKNKRLGKVLGKVLTGEVGVITPRSPDTVRGADVAYISFERLRAASAEGYLDVAPELIAEIISPNDRWTDINEKLEEYCAIGTVVVGIVNPRERRVHVFRSPTQIQKLGPEDVLTLEDLLPGLRIRVGELFSD